MDNIKIIMTMDAYVEEFKFNNLTTDTIIKKVIEVGDFNTCGIYVLHMFNSINFEKIDDDSFTLQIIKNSVATLNKEICFKFVIGCIKDFIEFIKENIKSKLLLKLDFIGNDEMILNNFMITKNNKKDSKDLEIILHTPQVFEKNQYFYFFINKSVDKIIFSCDNCKKFSYSIFNKNHLTCNFNNLKCINFKDRTNNELQFNKDSDKKPFDWTYNLIKIQTKDVIYSSFNKLFLENKISNYYGDINYKFKKGTIDGNIDISRNEKLITSSSKSVMFERIHWDHFKGDRIIYVYIQKNTGEVKIFRECFDSPNNYLPEYDIEYEVKDGHNCFIFKSRINDKKVKEEHIGIKILSLKDKVGACQIANAKVFNIQNTFICTKVKSILGGINDEPNNKKDLLNYEKYAKVLSELILKNSITPPITFGIYSEWGSGKSFLLNQIKKIIKYHEYIGRKDEKCCYFNCFLNCQENFIISDDKEDRYKLEEEGRQIKNCFKILNPCYKGINYFRKTIVKNYIFIEFNAWEYSGSDILWAGLVKCMYDKLEEEFGTIIFRLIIYYYSTFDFCNLLCQLLKYIIIISVGYIISANLNNSIASQISELSGIAISILTMLPGLKNFIINIYKGESKLLEEKINKINNKVGFMAVVREKIEMLSIILERFNCQPIIFIDDIDRCTHDKAVQVLNAVKLLLSGSTKFYTFLAIDPRLVVKAIESSYKETIVKAGITGYDFIDKIVQIPFVLPKQNMTIKKHFLKGIFSKINRSILSQYNNEVVEEKSNDETNQNNINNDETNQNNINNDDSPDDEKQDNKFKEELDKIIKGEEEEEIEIVGTCMMMDQDEYELQNKELSDNEDEKQEGEGNEESNDSEEKNNIESNDSKKQINFNNSLITNEEIKIFNKYADFLDSNGRRLVRIVNVYILSKNFYNSKKNIKNISNIFEKIIYSIILSEQWSYRTSFILLFLDIKYSSTSDFENKFKNKSIKDLYNENIKNFIYRNDKLFNLSYNDSRYDKFDSILNEFIGFNVVEFYFINKKYIFNLNPAITEEILREINKDELKDLLND